MFIKSFLTLAARSVVAVCGIMSSIQGQAADAPKATRAFAAKYCYDCHDSETKKGGLDLTALPFNPNNVTNFTVWVKMHDRVVSGEMPPSKKPRPVPKDLAGFTNVLFSALLTADRAKVADEGRATQRRLNRYEYEDTLRDLLSLPYLEVKAFLPEDTEAHGFNKVGDALDVSHVQMARYLAASEFALRQAMAPQSARPETISKRFYAWEEREFFGKIKLF